MVLFDGLFDISLKFLLYLNLLRVYIIIFR